MLNVTHTCERMEIDLSSVTRAIQSVREIVGEVDAWHEVGGAEGDLFRFRKKICHVLIQRQFADPPGGNQFLRPKFGGVQYVEIEPELVLGVEDLNRKLELGGMAVLDVLPQIAADKAPGPPSLFVRAPRTELA